MFSKHRVLRAAGPGCDGEANGLEAGLELRDRRLTGGRRGHESGKGAEGGLGGKGATEWVVEGGGLIGVGVGVGLGLGLGVGLRLGGFRLGMKLGCGVGLRLGLLIVRGDHDVSVEAGSQFPVRTKTRGGG